MSLDPAIFRALVEQGATPEMLLAVVEASAAVDEARREKKRAGNAARQSRHRAKNNASNALQCVTERDPPNDIYSNPPGLTPTSPDGEASPEPEVIRVSVDHLQDAWNSGPGSRGAVQCRDIKNGRRIKANRFIKRYTVDDITEAISAAAKSDFLCGRTDKGFRADIEFLFVDKHMNRLLEGFYERN